MPYGPLMPMAVAIIAMGKGRPWVLHKQQGPNMWEWNWRREIKGRESGELGMLMERLGDKIPTQGAVHVDTSYWWFDTNGEFSVKKLRSLIDDKLLREHTNGLETSWIKEVPKKVSIFVWKLRQQKLPQFSINSLGVDLHSTLCPRCDDTIETNGHALLSCEDVRELWKEMFKWWGCELGNINSAEELLSFQDSVWGSERTNGIGRLRSKQRFGSAAEWISNPQL
ncbi:LOW QUALITY PROTEIN: hypothetical protein OSB04_028635, partial [Centaurea solstitialis]